LQWWGAAECVELAEVDEDVLSLQPPKKPGWWHEDELVEAVTCADVVVGVAEGAGVVILLEVVVGSLHPNQPGVLHVVVVEVLEDEVVEVVVVVWSRQPHHPGVLHVVVRVEVEVDELVVDVLLSEPLLSKNFQL
jgi:hypothetical protein